MQRVGRTTCLTLVVIAATAVFSLGLVLPRTSAESAEAPEPLVQDGDGMAMVDARDFKKIQGADSCSECHSPAYQAWRQSTHFATFKNRHSTPEAKKILANLGLKSMKRNDKCFNCHYTSQEDAGAKVTSISGVSCESCHGAGENWTSDALHHSKAKEAGDSAARDAILEQCGKAGMLRPNNIAMVARNCFTCHTVPDEELVNKGGHPAGSEIELVSWLQGEVRHNYQYSTDGKNRGASAERKRVLYVVGRVTDLEYALRGMTKITERGTYRTAMVARKNTATEQVDAILAAVSIPEIESVIKAAPRDENGRIKVSRSLLASLPDQLARASVDFVKAHDGSKLGAIDAQIPTKPRGTAQP